MKRKLDENDVPQRIQSDPTSPPLPPRPSKKGGFLSFGLESQLLQAIATEGYKVPTPVQSKVIPLALEGRDILARAKTGSGKTAAYLLPILNTILRRKAGDPQSQHGTTALILVPTRELAEQVSRATTTFAASFAQTITVANLAQKVAEGVQRSILASNPDVIVATPAGAVSSISNSSLVVDNLAHLVIDEADLVLSYGYEEDLQNVAAAVPKGLQTFLVSATLSTELDTLKGLFCRDPVIVALDDGEDDKAGVSQYIVKCGEDEKFLLAYVIFKLKLIKGKCIIFVADIDRSYRLKLFFEQFGIRSCVLNSELPVNSRIHVVQEFNKNVYDLLIASDEHEALGTNSAAKGPKTKRKKSKLDETEVIQEEEGDDHPEEDLEDVPKEETQAEKKEPEKIKPADKKVDKEYGISRGIDFQAVTAVLNFDLPLSSTSYLHRIGRTARAGRSGLALSFVVPKNLYRSHKPTSIVSAEHDEDVLTKITSDQASKGKELKPYHFDMAQVSAFKYRVNDALRAVTGVAVREARTRELRNELLKSEKLKRYFEENPDDLRHLRHDGELRAARTQAHLKHVPDYLLPRSGKESMVKAEGQHSGIGYVGMAKVGENRIRKARRLKRISGKGGKGVRKEKDPLKTFNARGRG
ncbi:ATP-dependent DNA/RNA helicase [Agyrium rufum]|nr:ATP-dependent DNA/RNA helicase [Agyrium rufum]